MKATKPAALLFDFDDTLISSQSLIHQALKQTLIEFKLIDEWTMADIKKWSVKSAKDYFPKFFKQQALAAIDFYRMQYISLSERGLPPLDNALATLEYLAGLEKKIFVGVVSNKLGTLLRQEIIQLGWHKYFDAIVGSGDALKDKPAAEPLKLALANSGGLSAENSHIWFIGDSYIDMQAAHQFGCYSILIRELYDLESFKDFPPHTHVTNHCELLSMIKLYL